MKTLFAIVTICFFSSLPLCGAENKDHMRKSSQREQPCANDPIRLVQCFDECIGTTKPDKCMEKCCKQ